MVLAVLPDTVNPLGSVSVNGAVIVSTVLLAFVKVMVRVEIPPALTRAGLKALLTSGVAEAAVTVKVATAGLALLPLLVSRAPTPIELV